MNVALSVITCNAPQAAARTVRSAGLPLDRCIVVSNGSCDAADAEIATALPGLAELVHVRPAHGVSYCMNVGLRLPAQRTWRPRPEWAVLTQDDVGFDADWMARLTAAIAEKPNALQFNMAYPTCSYSCVAIHRDLVKAIGWWDERFTGMFFEDDDWHLRLSEFAGCPPGTRVHEKDVDGIFASVKCARHGGDLQTERAKDRARFGFKSALSRAVNEEFFYRKWRRSETGGWAGKGKINGQYSNWERALPEVNPYPGVSI
jgi:GT2 family glycosyltransferase